MCTPLTFRPFRSWIRASYSTGRSKFLDPLPPFQHTFWNCLETSVRFAPPHLNSLNTYTRGCPLSLRNASTNCTSGHRSNLDQMLFFFYFLSSSLQCYLPQVHGILGLPCIMPRKFSTLKSKALVYSPLRFCRLGYCWLSTNLDMLYTLQLSCLLVHVLAMHTLLASTSVRH